MTRVVRVLEEGMKILCPALWVSLLVFFPIVWAVDMALYRMSPRQSAVDVLKAWKASYLERCHGVGAQDD
jgi:hypothetical protein